MPPKKKGKTEEGVKKPKEPDVYPRGRIVTHVPGDKQRCAICKDLFLNVIQHRAERCDNSTYYLELRKKFWKAYMYLLKRHKRHRRTFQHPGNFLMAHNLRPLSPSSTQGQGIP